MKKFFLLTSLSLLLLVSCKEEGVKISGSWEFGLMMYRHVNYENTEITHDPAYIAFRLNMLLTETQFQGKNLNDFASTEVKPSGVSSLNLKNFLFSGNRIENNNGVWTIYFTPGVYSENSHDRNRSGNVIIDTRAGSGTTKLLDELQTGEAWTMSFQFGQGGMENPSFEGYAHIYSDASNLLTFSDYTIRKRNRGEWNISGVSSSTMEGTNSYSSWIFDFNLTRKGTGAAQTYANVYDSYYELTGEASGIPFYTERKFYYQIQSPLKIKPGCSPVTRYGGRERIEVDKDEFESDGGSTNDEERIINIRYEEVLTEDCRAYTHFSYMGESIFG